MRVRSQFFWLLLAAGLASQPAGGAALGDGQAGTPAWSNPLDELLRQLNETREAGELTLDELLNRYDAAYRAAPPEVQAEHRRHVDRALSAGPQLIRPKQEP
jgi:hypothetical protein